MGNNSAPGNWLIAQYAPVSLFSLRSTYSTNKGGKTLLVPTPYAVKMALLDACFRVYPSSDAESAARRTFDRIKAQPVRVQPPAECIVQNTFVRMLQPARNEAEEMILRQALLPGQLRTVNLCFSAARWKSLWG